MLSLAEKKKFSPYLGDY